MVVLPTETRRDWPLARAALHRLRRAVVGQILISSRVAHAVEAVAILEDLGNLELRGLRRPVAAFNVVQSSSAAEARPNLTVVARGPEP